MMFPVLVMQILAIVYIVTGVRGLLDDSFFDSLISHLEKNIDSGYFWGIVGVVLGMVFISSPYVHLNNWTIVVAIIGWISLCKGVAMMFMPQEFLKLFAFLGSKKNSFGVSIAILLLGFVCSYFGFFA